MASNTTAQHTRSRCGLGCLISHQGQFYWQTRRQRDIVSAFTGDPMSALGKHRTLRPQQRGFILNQLIQRHRQTGNLSIQIIVVRRQKDPMARKTAIIHADHLACLRGTNLQHQTVMTLAFGFLLQSLDDRAPQRSPVFIAQFIDFQRFRDRR